MEIQITGKGLELSIPLKTHIEESIESHVKKYFHNAINAKVVLYKEGQLFHADIIVNEGVSHGVFIKASARNHNAYHTVDSCIIRLSGKLRRYKHKINDYNKPKKGIKALQSMIKRSAEIEEEPLPHEESGIAASLITEEKTIDVQALSVADAVMHMDLTAVPALMFINKDNHQLNMVYKRKDGNITWVEAPDVLHKLL